jgi:hypothetical protein
MKKQPKPQASTPELTKQEQSIQGKGSYTFSAFPLYEHKTPVFIEDDKTGIVNYGQENNYPDYLNYLYDRSSTHAAIINAKQTYLLGKGWQIKEDFSTEERAKAQKFIKSVNAYQTLDEMSRQLFMEWMIYGGYALRIRWNEDKIVSIKIQPFNTIRTNIDRTEFYVSTEWTKDMSLDPRWRPYRGLPKGTEIIKKFNPAKTKGEQILYVADWRSGMKVYPLPHYEAAIAAIETEVEIRNFDLNNIKTGWAAGTMITLFDGEPSEENKKGIEKQLKAKFGGSDNAGELVINYQKPGTQEPVVTRPQADDLADQFEQLDPRVTQAIITGHSVTSGMLFGIKEAGQLGGRSEMRTAWEIFYSTWVQPKQNSIENDINYLGTYAGLPYGILEITQLEPVGLDITLDDLKSGVGAERYREFVLNKMGLKPRDKSESEQILDTLGALSPIVANKLMNSISVNELRKMINLKSIDGGDAIGEQIDEATQNFKKQKFAEDIMTYKLCHVLGESCEKFEVIHEGSKYEFDTTGLNNDTAKLLTILEKKPSATLGKLASDTGFNQEKVLRLLEEISRTNRAAIEYTEKNGVVTVKSEINIKAPEQEEGFRIETRWQYAGVKDSRNRDFCAKLLNAARLYTRAEIDNLSNDMEEFNTDVWQFRGGWYNNPSLQVNTPYCRHFWQQVLVRRKS